MVLPLGPEPVPRSNAGANGGPRRAASPAASSPQSSQSEVAEAAGKDAFCMPPGLGMLLPPGLTLARAASLPLPGTGSHPSAGGDGDTAPIAPIEIDVPLQA